MQSKLCHPMDKILSVRLQSTDGFACNGFPMAVRPSPIAGDGWCPCWVAGTQRRNGLMRWGKDGAVCPRCGGDQPYKLTPKATSAKPGRKGLYKCRACRKQFTVTVGTVFEDSHIPISKWLLAIHLLASSKKGMSPHQLHRNLGVSYKGAWFMAHRLRYAMAQGPLTELMKGTVEIDETYVGAKKKRGTGKGRPSLDSHKTPVVALVERGTGRVRAFPMMRVTARTLGKAVDSMTAHNSTMMTDEFSAYKSVAEDLSRKHITVNHTKEEYVRGDVLAAQIL